MSARTLDNFTGCLLGGAAGDALGAPTEFLSRQEILETYGPGGISEYDEFAHGRGEVTDDTQMELFTAEAILQAGAGKKEYDAVIGRFAFEAYLRWYDTQTLSFEESMVKNKHADHPGWLVFDKRMYKRRAPGYSCLTALEKTSRTGQWGTVDHPVNDSKGCGAVMRMAPLGLIHGLSPEHAFRDGVQLAAMTHGHPDGYLPAGFLACLIAFIQQGHSLRQSIDSALTELSHYNHHENTEKAILQAIHSVEQDAPTIENLEKLGGGWVGEEALAISLFCALHYPTDFKRAILLAVNHSGDTDSTGSITGNILGLLLGEKAIPASWIQYLNMEPLIREMAKRMFDSEGFTSYE